MVASWTEVNDLTRGHTSPQASVALDGHRCKHAGLVWMVVIHQHQCITLTESWDGTNWTEVGDLNTGRSYGAGSGTTNTAALCFQVLCLLLVPLHRSQTPLVEQYNGSASGQKLQK